MKVSAKTARRIALHAQLLDGRTKFPKGKEGAAQIIESLCYVQIDSISVVQRAHHHTLWTRHPGYNPNIIHQLQAVDRRIFEYSGHALSYLPMRDFRFYMPRMRKLHDPYDKWEKNRYEKYRHLMKPVLERFRKEGALGLSAFSFESGRKPRAPEERDPYKSAIELLQLGGELFVTERKPTERIFDIAERVIPSDTDMRMPNDDELGRFLVRSALNSYGIATIAEMRDHIRTRADDAIANSLIEMIESGEVVRVDVEEDGTRENYALSDSVGKLTKLRKGQPRLYFISPFDNLIIQRDRIERLFNFDYALECYVTPTRRKYGYMVHPILWDEELVGRFDPKAERKKKQLVIKNLRVERSPDDSDAFLAALASKLAEYAIFNRCKSVSLDCISPSKLETPINRLLKAEGVL
jgi:uncharacterized protein YcaQ